MLNFLVRGYFFLFDPLCLFFLAVIFIVSIPSLIYSLGYLKHEYSPARIFYGQLISVVFIISMVLVVSVRNAFYFLVAWELMSLTSYFLVIFDLDHEKSLNAGVIYLVMTHIATAFLASAILILYSYSGSFDFEAMRAAALMLPSNIKNIVFLLFLIGFGTKAGIVPLHIWLPYAHPQAPSHISSIMSGVMIKTAIYGIIRFVMFLLGVNDLWWGGLILTLAIVSCLVGVIYALMEHDLKKLLAYHSVENIGIILLGVGAAMVLFALKLNTWAILALCAGLYHLVNHAIFKGLLFLCSGSVYKETKTRNIEELGGLIKKMPYTALFFLIGALGISAIPPLNGFVSEWLTLQAFFFGVLNSPLIGVKIMLGLSAAILMLTSGLAAACFVKAFGITFLALPRSRHAEEAREAPFTMKCGMFILAALTILFGLAAAVIIKLLTKVSENVLRITDNTANFTLNNFTLNPAKGVNIYLSTPLAAFLLAGAAIATVILVFVFCGRRKVKMYNTWDCGYYKIGPRNEYTATAFSKPFRVAFSFFLLPYRKSEKIRESFYHVKSFSYETDTVKIFKEYIYDSVLFLVYKSARFLKRMQPGSIHLYLSYIFLTVLLLVIFMHEF